MPPRWLIVGNPESRRFSLFQEALSAQGLPPAILIAWADLLREKVSLDTCIRPGDHVRIESPGRDFAVEKLLLAEGADETEEAEYAGIFRSEALALAFDKGEILYPRQWYRGLRRALHRIADQLSAAQSHTALSDPAEIALLFDKPACQAHLASCGIPTPRPLGLPSDYADLVARMEQNGIRRVFVKLAHGSSASGVIAYRYSARDDRHQALTTVETASTGAEGMRLFNTRKVRLLEDQAEIAALVDALCRHRACAEEWLPKPSLPGYPGAFDLRALTIAGRLRHVVARCSQTPMTNLHLLNSRAPAEAVRAHVGEAAWANLETVAAQSAAAFPRSLHIGLDVMWTPGLRRLAVLEANSFGDLLLGTCSEGESTYEAEIRAAGSRTPC